MICAGSESARRHHQVSETPAGTLTATLPAGGGLSASRVEPAASGTGQKQRLDNNPLDQPASW